MFKLMATQRDFHLRYFGIYTKVAMKEPNPREAVLVDQFREKLAQSPKHVFSHTELLPLVFELRVEHAFPRSLSERNFLRRLIEDGVLKEIPLNATYAFDAKRYHWGPFSDYELALSLRPGAYLSHGAAALLHHLMDHDPATIYINKEQSPKPSKGSRGKPSMMRNSTGSFTRNPSAFKRLAASPFASFSTTN